MNVITLKVREGGIKSQLTKLIKFFREEIEQYGTVNLTNKIVQLYKLLNKLEDLKLNYHKILKDTELQVWEEELGDTNEDFQKHIVSLKCFLNSKVKKRSDIKCINNNQS